MKSYSVRPEVSPEEGRELAEYTELTRHLLYHRGVRGREEALRFLAPDFVAHTHDPFLMKGIESAVGRILEAIKRGERVAIWSDYDADGIPGAVALHDFFKKIGFTNFQNYIPHRHDEGFGLNSEGLEELAAGGVKLIITIDCGIADVKEVAWARELGMEVIITDHHLPNGTLPEVFAILNPKQSDCPYPFKDLCGAGVVFKLIQALVSRLQTYQLTNLPTYKLTPGWEKWLLDLIGLATISDMVPLTGENRVFAYYGLLVLRKSRRPGLQKLLVKLRINQRFLTEDDIGFMIAPRLNAASRMGVPMDAFHLLSTEDEVLAGSYAEHLEKINAERKGVVASMVKEMKHAISARYSEQKKLIVLGNPNWRPSLLGLAAGTLSEEHSCPVFIWGRDGGNTLKGSCRSDGSVNIVELMAESRAFLEFGGHAGAGGFSVSHERVHLLETELERAYERVRSSPLSAAAAERGAEVVADRRLSLDEVNERIFSEVERLAPFGTGNPKPVFLFENISPVAVKQFGKEKNHLELSFEKPSGGAVKAISFFSAPEKWGRMLRAGEKINLVASLEKSYFGRYPEIRLRIVDVF